MSVKHFTLKIKKSPKHKEAGKKIPILVFQKQLSLIV